MLEPGEAIALAEGDRLEIGAWTAMTVRRGRP
jgi:hypothetical protein